MLSGTAGIWDYGYFQSVQIHLVKFQVKARIGLYMYKARRHLILHVI